MEVVVKAGTSVKHLLIIKNSLFYIILLCENLLINPRTMTNIHQEYVWSPVIDDKRAILSESWKNRHIITIYSNVATSDFGIFWVRRVSVRMRRFIKSPKPQYGARLLMFKCNSQQRLNSSCVSSWTLGSPVFQRLLQVPRPSAAHVIAYYFNVYIHKQCSG